MSTQGFTLVRKMPYVSVWLIQPIYESIAAACFQHIGPDLLRICDAFLVAASMMLFRRVVRDL